MEGDRLHSRLLRLTSAVVALLGGGCGTFSNVVWLAPSESGQQVYGGVRCDLDVMQRAADGQTGIYESGKEVKDPVRQAQTILTGVVDLPLSAFGDTLTLPYIFWVQAVRQQTPEGTSGGGP